MHDLFNHHILNHLFDGLYIIDKDKRIVFWNKSAESITGFTCAEVVGLEYCCNVLMHIDDEGKSLCDTDCPLEKTLIDRQTREISVFIRHKKGYRTPVSVRVAPLVDKKSKVVGAVEIFSDKSATEQFSREIEELSNLALVDNLTGLRNRRFGENLLKTKLWEVGGGGSPFGMLFFDIDFFKLINDKYGHNVGDEVLKSLCNTLFSGLRASDILVRWGGEEIVAILPGEVSFSQLQKVADKIRLLVEKSSHLTSEGALYVTISVGGTLSLYGDTVQSIVKRVDKLMYQSKAKGRNCVTVG